MLMCPAKSRKIRNDAGGSGFFGARRSKLVGGEFVRYKHKGVDYEVIPGEEIYMPLTGKIVREARPYATGSYSGVLIEARRGSFKIFYFEPIKALIGEVVKIGSVIGYAQDISQRYEKVTPHIHFEVVSLDPEVLINN